MSPYRSAAAVAPSLEALEREIAALELRIAPDYWDQLGAGLRDAHRAAFEGRTDERAAALLRYRDQLRDAVARGPRLEASLRALPAKLPRAAVRKLWPRGEEVTLRAREWAAHAIEHANTSAERLARFVGQIDAAAVVWCRGRNAIAPAFRHHDSPMALRVEEPLLGEPELVALTAVPRGATQHGAARAAAPALRALAQHAEPLCTIGAGVAELRWRYAFSETVVELGLIALARLRHAPIALQLLR